MTANHSIDAAQFLSEHLERAEPDLLRSMLRTFIDTLMRGLPPVWLTLGVGGS